MVAHSAFDEDTRDQNSLRDVQSLQVVPPYNPILKPGTHHLAWHRELEICDLEIGASPTAANGQRELRRSVVATSLCHVLKSTRPPPIPIIQSRLT